MHDVLRQLVLAAGDPHLVPEEAVRPVLLPLGPRAHIGERRSRLRLREAHRAQEAALHHGAHVGVDLLLRAVREDEVGVAHREERVRGRADVRGLEPGEARVGDHRRQLSAAHLVVHGARDEPRLPEDPERLLHLGDDVNPLPVEGGLLRVVLLVVRGEVPRRDLLAQLERRVEGLSGVVRVPLAGRERADIEPLVQQELEIAAGQQQGCHAFTPGALVVTGGAEPRGRRAPPHQRTKQSLIRPVSDGVTAPCCPRQGPARRGNAVTGEPASRTVLDDGQIRHLELIQTVAARMGNNSFLIKGWALTLMGALLAFAAGNESRTVAATAFVPIVTFCCSTGISCTGSGCSGGSTARCGGRAAALSRSASRPGEARGSGAREGAGVCSACSGGAGTGSGPAF